MKDEASRAGEKYKEAEVMLPKVLLYIPGGTHSVESQPPFLDLDHVETQDLGHFQSQVPRIRLVLQPFTLLAVPSLLPFFLLTQISEISSRIN